MTASPTCFCAHVRGGCQQGRRCRLRDTELAAEIPHSDTRVIAPPRAPRTRPADPMQRRRLSRAGATAAIALIAFGLLCLWGSTRAHAAPVAVVFVGRS